MTIIIAALVGFVAGRMLWLALRKSWRRDSFMRQNFSGVSLPTAAGVVLPLALIVVEAGRAIAGGFGVGDDPVITATRAAVLIAVVGFAMLGLLDDLAGRTDVRGFAGHLKALSRGQLTSGGVKMLGGLTLSVVAAVFLVGDQGGFAILLAAGIIALSANLINLFDLRPGRANKVSLLAFAVLAVATLFDAALVPVAVTIGAAAALLIDDLHERLMLGDTGANAMGAALGVGIVSQLGTTGLVVAFVALVAFNLASEFVSFTKIIESVGPLRSFDQLGRRKAPFEKRTIKPEPTIDVRDEQPERDSVMTTRPDVMSTRVNVGGAPDAGNSQGTQSGQSASAKQDRPFARKPNSREHWSSDAPEDDATRW